MRRVRCRPSQAAERAARRFAVRRRRGRSRRLHLDAGRRRELGSLEPVARILDRMELHPADIVRLRSETRATRAGLAA